MVTVIQPLLNEESMKALERICEYLADEAQEYAALPPEERPNHIYNSVLVLRTDVFSGRPLFDQGKLVTTPGAMEAITEANQAIWEFTSRHTAGDWGDVGFDDWTANNTALEEGTRLLSSYRTTTGQRIWIITEADRSLTTLLLPEEY